MDISKLKRVVIGGVDDGAEYALIVGNTVYIVQAHSMYDAIKRMKTEANIDDNEWIISKAKAVLVPGIWEYELAVCNRGMASQQVIDLVNELYAEVA